jgi:hypothetical protein
MITHNRCQLNVQQTRSTELQMMSTVQSRHSATEHWRLSQTE